MHRDKLTLKYFLYARKSSETDERQIQSIEDQVQLMRGVARDLGLHVIECLSEAKSAKEPYRRTVFDEMLKRIERGEAQGLIVWKIDRLSRNPIDSGRIQWLLQNGILQSIQTIGREYQPEDNALILGVETSMASQYIVELRQNVKRGMESKIKKGWMPGMAPPGYLNTKILEKGENYIIEDPERFPLIRKAWDLMLTGRYIVERILEKLNTEWGYCSRRTKKRVGNGMYRSTLYRIFTNPFYAGIIEYGGYYQEGKHRPMVTMEEFEKVQFLLRRKGNPRFRRMTYAYTGLLRCGECGGMASATYKQKLIKESGEIKDYTLYYCINGRKKQYGCTQVKYLNEEVINQEIKAFLVSLTIPEWLQKWAIEKITQHVPAKVIDENKIREQHQKAVGDLEKQLSTLTQMRVRGLIDDEEFSTEKSRLQKELVATKLKQNQIGTLTDIQELTAETFDFACHALSKFRTSTAATKKEILAGCSLNWTLLNKKTNIEAAKWVKPFQNLHLIITSYFGPFEPEKYPSVASQNDFFERFRNPLLAQCDAIGTSVNKFSKSDKGIVQSPGILKK
jgi:site-specific DNA recombinase